MDDMEWLDCGEVSLLLPLPEGETVESALADVLALLNGE